MVSYILWTAFIRCLVTRAPNNPAETASSRPSCLTTRDVLLHNDRLVKLAPGKIAFLVHIGVHNRENNGLQTSSRWYEMGSEALLRYESISDFFQWYCCIKISTDFLVLDIRYRIIVFVISKFWPVDSKFLFKQKLSNFWKNLTVCLSIA